jgi:hypothetical protein
LGKAAPGAGGRVSLRQRVIRSFSEGGGYGLTGLREITRRVLALKLHFATASFNATALELFDSIR